MNILIPILGFTKSGGMRVLTKLSNNWVRQGNEVTILVSSKNGKPYYPVLDDVNIVYINSDCEGGSYWFNLLNSIIGLYKYLKEFSCNYDAVIANYHLTAYAVIFGSRANNFYYIQAYEPEFYSAKKYSLLAHCQYFVAWLTYCLPITRIVNADIYRSYKNLKANYVVYPGLDTKVFCHKGSTKEDGFTVGCIGRKQKWKGSDDVGEALKIVHERGYRDIILKVAFNRISSYENYEFTVPDGDENLADFYRSLDILVAPGHIQLGAIHYPVVEAMACKVPVITSGYYPACSDNALIVPIKSPNDIADAIIHVYRNRSEAAEKAKKAYIDVLDLSWENVSNNFIDIIKEEIDSSPKSI